jgi:membrane protein implicated in regulation of membrane protease activity
MGSWIAWLIVAALLGVAEVMTATLAFGLLAVAAVVAAGAGLGGVRPLAVRHIRQPPLLRTGTSALIGRSALVIEEVTAHDGRVRIGGEVWSARSYEESQVIPAGSTVDVFAIEGATALVHPRE